MSWFFLCNTNFMHPAGMLGSEETTCTTRVSKSYVYGEITDHALSHKLSQVIIPEETTCTTRTLWDCVWREITESAYALML